MCRLLGLMALRKGERFGLSKCTPYIAWKEVVSRGDRTEDRKPERSTHKVWGVSSIFHNSEMHFPDFYSGWYLSPNFPH